MKIIFAFLCAAALLTGCATHHGSSARFAGGGAETWSTGYGHAESSPANSYLPVLSSPGPFN